MTIKKNDISTWPKTSDILYASDDFQVAEKLLELEELYYKRDYNIVRIKGRMKRLHTRGLVNNSAVVLKGIKPSRLKNVKRILSNVATLRLYIQLSGPSITQLYSLIRYEFEHEDRKDIKRVLATHIVRGGDIGIGKKH